MKIKFYYLRIGISLPLLLRFGDDRANERDTIKCYNRSLKGQLSCPCCLKLKQTDHLPKTIRPTKGTYGNYLSNKNTLVTFKGRPNLTQVMEPASLEFRVYCSCSRTFGQQFAFCSATFLFYSKLIKPENNDNNFLP